MNNVHYTQRYASRFDNVYNQSSEGHTMDATSIVISLVGLAILVISLVGTAIYLF